MDVRDQLLKAHSRANADRVLQYIFDDPERVPELMALFFSEEVLVAQRAAMVVGDLGRAKPAWLSFYQEELLAAAREPIHPAIRRSVTRYFSELPISNISDKVEGPLVDLAFALTENPGEPVAIRVFAMQIAYNFCARYPELGGELRETIAGDLAAADPGFRSRGRKMLRALEKLEKQ